MPQITKPLILEDSCPIGDGSGNYPYCGPCPGIEVKGSLEAGPCRRFGFLEFSALSNPPRVFANYKISGTLKDTWSDSAGSPSSGSNECDGIASDVPYPGGGNDVTFTTVSGSSTTTTSGNKFMTGIGPLAIVNSNFGGATTPSVASGNLAGAGINYATGPSGIALPATLAGSGTSATVTVSSGSVSSGTITYTVHAGTLTIDLDGELSDAAAIAATTLNFSATDSTDPTDHYGFSSGLFSLYENRSNISVPAFNFGYQTATFAVYLTNLLWGGALAWTLDIKIEERAASGDGSGDTSLYGSTWSEVSGAVSPIGITPTADTWDNSGTPITIPQAAGKQRRIKSIALTPNWA